MIVYIHGFGSSSLSPKAEFFKKSFKGGILAPTLSNIPHLAVDTLDQMIECLLKKGEKVSLIGSSIGGYLSIYFASKYNLKAVLINPAIYPYNLNAFVGPAKSSYDESYFECTSTHLENLKEYEVKEVKHQKNFMVLLQKGDELLDYKEAKKKLPKAKLIVDDGGSHSYENLEEKLKKIKKFLEY